MQQIVAMPSTDKMDMMAAYVSLIYVVFALRNVESTDLVHMLTF